MSKETDKKDTTDIIPSSQDKGEIVPATPSGLMTQERMVNLVEGVIKDLDIVKKEALEGFYIFKDLLANEGEGSAATKEQMGAMLQIYLSTVDSGLKTVDLLLKSQKQAAGPGSKADGGNSTVNIIPGMSRREMLEEIERIMDPQDGRIEVIEEEDQEEEPE